MQKLHIKLKETMKKKKQKKKQVKSILRFSCNRKAIFIGTK